MSDSLQFFRVICCVTIDDLCEIFDNGGGNALDFEQILIILIDLLGNGEEVEMGDNWQGNGGGGRKNLQRSPPSSLKSWIRH